MKIKPDHALPIGRLPARENTRAGRPCGGTPPGAGIEQKQISGMAAFLKAELEKAEHETDPSRAAQLRNLQDAIERGVYRTDPAQLARAMLTLFKR